MYEIQLQCFNDILLDKNDQLLTVNNIVFNNIDYNLYSFYRYFKFSNCYCAYEFLKEKNLFVFFPGSEVNTHFAFRKNLDWRNRDYYLDARLFIYFGLLDNIQHFLKTSTQIYNVNNIHICSFSLGGVAAYFYLLNLLENIDKYSNIQNIYLEFYSAIGLTKIYRDKIAEKINQIANVNKNLFIRFRYHIVNKDIVPFICCPFLFTYKDIIANNIIQYLYFYKINGFKKQKPAFNNCLFLSHSNFCHSLATFKNINKGYINSLLVFDKISEAYSYLEKCMYYEYKQNVCWFNFLIFLYKNYGVFLGAYNLFRFYTIINMYKNMSLSIIDLYNSEKLNNVLFQKVKIENNKEKIYYLKIFINFYKYFLKLCNIVLYPLFFSFELFYYLTSFFIFLIFSIINLFLCSILLFYTILLDYLRQLLETNIVF